MGDVESLWGASGELAACYKSDLSAVLEFKDFEGASMPYVDIVTALAILQFIVFGYRVGAARGRYKVAAPAVAGHEVFERVFRVQQNTLEQLIAFLPGLYLFSHYWGPYWAAALGVIYLIGRELYAYTYVRNPAKREIGFAMTALPVMVLLVGGLVGAVRAVFYLH
jgi:glutathione S-transferase